MSNTTQTPQKRLSGSPWTTTLLAGICLLLATGPALAAKPRLSIVPFISTESGSQSTYKDVSRKLTGKLKGKGFDVIPVSAKGRQAQQVVLPGKSSFVAWKKSFAAGKAQLRLKKPDKAKGKLEAARKHLTKGLAHIKEFDQVMELYRLLGLCYFRMGMGEEGEEIIRELGVLVPRYKFSVSKMPPAMGRVLKRAQKRAAAAKNKLILTVPSGSSLQLDRVKSDNVSGEVPIKNLANGKHYLWVRKAGFLPFAKQISVKNGTTRLTIKLKPLPKASGPNLSPQISLIRASLQRRALTRSVGKAAQKIATGLGVPQILMGYFHKADGGNNLHLFVYRSSDQVLKKYTPVKFDNELLELDIKLVTMTDKLKKAILNSGSLPTQAWMAPAAARPAPRPAAVAVRKAPPKRRAPVVDDDDDDDDDDLDNPKDVKVVGGPQIVRRPAPRPVARRVEPRPVPRRVEPRPVPRRTAPPARRVDDDDDDDDFDGGSKRRTPPPRRVQPRPAPRKVEPRPVVRRTAPPPRRVAVPIPMDRDAPASLRRDRDALRRDRKAGRIQRRRVARAVRKSRSFDPDRDIDWSNPIPQNTGRSRTDDDDDPPVRAAVKPAPIRPRPIPRRVEPQPTPRSDDDDDDDPPPARNNIVRPTPPPARRRADDDWSSRPKPIANGNKTQPKSGVTRKWWFWTAIGVGTAAAAGAVIGLAVIHSGPGQAFNVHITPNPPPQ